MQYGVIQLISVAFSFVFAFWPFVLLSVLVEWRGRNFMRLFAVAFNVWVVIAVMRIVMLFTATPAFEILLKEPARTIWFVVIGVILASIRIGNIYWKRNNVDYVLPARLSSVKSNSVYRRKQYGHPNIHILLNRMDDASSRNDYAGVLHSSASVFETVAKDVVGISTVQDKTLKQFFDRYKNDSSLPPEILNYIKNVYEKRNTTPLAGHGSTQIPVLTERDAIVLSD